MAEQLFMHAAQSGHIEELALLLERGRVRADYAAPPLRTTALHAACRRGDSSMVALLLAARANVNHAEVPSCGSRAPLHIAAEADLLGIATQLLDAGASVIPCDSLGRTPLHVASQEGCLELSRLLLARGADPHLRDSSGHNAAWWAKEFGQREVLELFQSMSIEPRDIPARDFMVHVGARHRTSDKKKKKAADPKSGRGTSRGR
eukprot:TRINITY_DN14393_c0_g4_i2.p1 TRINITY_DN14393_c0_g4~~TRINITY_DN14393_c0_g4_i2.p1  ORF type:complete len:224 (+),score=55.59 TRINITY_DN14393_c0_g4_i2:60-674(+)